MREWKRIGLYVGLIVAFTCARASADEMTDGVAAQHAGDYAKAVAIYKKLSDQGNADAETNLGLMYFVGKGVPQDTSEAVRWWQKAAAQGNVLAEGDLGESYHTGRGIAKDLHEARKWLTLAAAGGNPSAQFELGLIYAKGEGLPPDAPLAYVWFSMAANKGMEAAIADKNIARHNMTPAEIQKADQWASQCRNSNFKHCGV